ncbi:hypothetical protein VUR80DRAFT_9283 [Thermomyces stellatus]
MAPASENLGRPRQKRAKAGDSELRLSKWHHREKEGPVAFNPADAFSFPFTFARR